MSRISFMILIPAITVWQWKNFRGFISSKGWKYIYSTLFQVFFAPVHGTSTKFLWNMSMTLAFEEKQSVVPLVIKGFSLLAMVSMISFALHAWLSWLTSIISLIALSLFTDIMALLVGQWPFYIRYAPKIECNFVFGMWYFFDLILGLNMGRQFLWARRFRTVEPAPHTPSTNCTVLHLSDLHIVGNDSAYRVESWGIPPQGNQGIGIAFERYRNEMQAADAITISGDITDTGSDQEWANFLSLWETLPANIRNRFFLVPGNHDLNLVAPTSKAFTTAEVANYAGRMRKEILFAKVLNQVQGGRCDVVRTIGTDEVKLLPMSDFIGHHLEFVNKFLSGEQPQVEKDVWGDLGYEIFPYVWRFKTAAGNQVALIGINSCVVSETVFGNAFGSVGLKKLEAVIKHLVSDGYFPIVVGHHHAIVRPIALPNLGVFQKSKSRLMSSGMGLINSQSFVDGLQRVAPQGFVYLHGHRHVARIFSGGTTAAPLPLFCSAPSLLFGDESKPNFSGRAALLGLTIPPLPNPQSDQYGGSVKFI